MSKTLEEAARELLWAMKLDPRAQVMEFGTEMEALRAALSTVDGMVRVPREPTEAMVIAGATAAVGLLEDEARDVWDAMLAAAEKERDDGR